MNPRLSSKETFWNWFTEHQDFLLSLNAENYYSISNRISKMLSPYATNIFCDIAPTNKDDVFELYFTAFGTPDLFEPIKELVDAAPEELSKNWIFYALYPPKREHLTIKLKSNFINTRDIYFEYAEIKGEYFVMLAVKNLLLKEEDVDEKLIASLQTAVDSILGEEFATRLISGYVIANYESLSTPISLIDISDYIK